MEAYPPVADGEINCDARSMREVVVDCSGIESTEEFWQRYLDVAKAEGVAMFGRNLDAFWDAIEGGGPGWPGTVSLVFTHSAQLSGLRTRGGNASFLDALKTVASQASAVSIKFVD
ncbi:MAG TPA: barstar family protein [Kaistia sp.]|jgi:ribonuclease inhibitor|nr:barstar family protein [Kaistia sp.]